MKEVVRGLAGLGVIVAIVTGLFFPHFGVVLGTICMAILATVK